MSAGYDILDAVVALGTGSLLYQRWGFCVSYIYISGCYLVIVAQVYNKPFHESWESLQYHASSDITRAIRVTSKEKLYQ